MGNGKTVGRRRSWGRSELGRLKTKLRGTSPGYNLGPVGWLVPLALKALRKGGALALAGMTMSAIPEMPYELLYRERTVRSVANPTRQDAQDLLALTVEIPIRTEVQVFPLEEVNHALVLLKVGRISGAGVLQIPST